MKFNEPQKYLRLCAASLMSAEPSRAQFGYYRTSGGAEIDLVIDLGKGELWAVEIKRSSAPSISKGFYSACEDLQPTKKCVVHSGGESFPLPGGIEAFTLMDLLAVLDRY